jgi:hypothetical protein
LPNHLHLGEIGDERFADAGNAGLLDIVAAWGES